MFAAKHLRMPRRRPPARPRRIWPPPVHARLSNAQAQLEAAKSQVQARGRLLLRGFELRLCFGELGHSFLLGGFKSRLGFREA